MIARPLQAAARHGRLLLVLGLVAGVTLPGLAAAMRPWLPGLVAALLFLAVLRIGPRQALGATRDLGLSLRVILAYQVALPLAALGAFALMGLGGSLTATAVVLVLAAAPLSGSPNLTILAGFDPAPALRLVVLGTALLPLTVLPVFWALAEIEEGAAVLASVGRLLAVILAAALVATALRLTVLRAPSAPAIAALDGLSAITMAVVVVALMSAVGPMLRTAPATVAYWVAVAFAANIGMQLAAAAVLGRRVRPDHLVPLSIIAGNRNIALFLVSVPPDLADRLLIFIGCYQIPMYLTPVLMSGFYRRSLTSAGPPSA
jgi:hypothetical protein